MKRYEATIGAYSRIIESESGGICLQLDQKGIRKIEGCIVGNYIYDLREFKRYYVIKRDEYGFLENSEILKIKTNIEYALEVSEKVEKIEDKKEKSKIYTFGKCRRR